MAKFIFLFGGQGFDVILVNGRQTKNIKGKKTDIKDCQWIQKLHSLGLLSASFLPDSDTDLNLLSYQYFEGIDLMAIEGVNEGLIMAIISEIGLDGIRKFPSAKQFTAWLRLAPNNKISGGKVLSHHIPKGSSRLKIAFRNTANAIGNLKEGWLVDFFKRINYKKGRATAVTALARKLAVIIWNMLVKGTNYNPPTEYLFLDEKRKLGIVKRIQKQISKFELTEEDLGFVNN